MSATEENVKEAEGAKIIDLQGRRDEVPYDEDELEKAIAFDRYWDSLFRGESNDSAVLDPETMAAARRLHQIITSSTLSERCHDKEEFEDEALTPMASVESQPKPMATIHWLPAIGKLPRLGLAVAMAAAAIFIGLITVNAFVSPRGLFSGTTNHDWIPWVNQDAFIPLNDLATPTASLDLPDAPTAEAHPKVREVLSYSAL